MTAISPLRTMHSMIAILFHPNPRQRWLARALLCLATLVVSYLVFSQPTSVGHKIPHFDKFSHFAAFFGLAALLQLASGIKRRWQIALLTAYAALIESVQDILPYRRADWLDFAADIFGALSFYLLLLMVQQWPRKVSA